ncbi:hypothetical protein ABGB18_33645 [Nonomuraea sp. B12E4]|uniref:hypothetical protein n=1 Tax=Nonomuraea sp. B12E4 TaxID=3153564 RepID=UPI00325D02C6
MSKITLRLATAAATLAVTGGIIFTTSGAASAATSRLASPGAPIATSAEAARHNGYLQRWDGRRWWFRYASHGDWYSAGHGERYRFDGHRFYRWEDGRWKPVSASYARHHSLDRDDLYGRSRVHHVDHNNRGHEGHAHHGDKGRHDERGDKGHDNDHGDHHSDHRDNDHSDNHHSEYDHR